jgi:REP element-mobilizing transposase RayT
MTRSRYRIYEKEPPYFLTCTIVGWVPVFTRPDTMDIILDSWRFLQEHKRLTIYAYCILENHLHLIASSNDLGKEIGDFKSFTARKIIDYFTEHRVEMILNHLQWFRERHKTDRDYQLWQEGSHPQQISGDEMMWQKIEYIHLNPVKRGFVDDPTHWRYSSARSCAGLPGLLGKTDWR